MNATQQENFVLGFNARVNSSDGKWRCPNRTHACQDGYSTANTLFNRAIAEAIKGCRNPVYPGVIRAADIAEVLRKADDACAINPFYEQGVA